MWNYPELFKSHCPYLFSSAACIALTGVVLFMHGCCFTLAPGFRWPSVPGESLWFHALLKPQEKSADLLGRGLHLQKQAGASALWEQHRQSFVIETSAAENFGLSYRDLGLSFVNEACGSQHLLYSCKVIPERMNLIPVNYWQLLVKKKKICFNWKVMGLQPACKPEIRSSQLSVHRLLLWETQR